MSKSEDGPETDPTLLERARALLARAPMVDGHNDLAHVIAADARAKGDIAAYGLDRVHDEGDTDIPRFREGRVGAQFFAAFQPTAAPHAARTTLERLDLIRRLAEVHPGTFELAREADGVLGAVSRGRIAVLPTVEGGVGLEGSLAPLRIWRAAGMTLMTLCHNESLEWVDSATDRPRCGGLSRFGVAVVEELNRLGVIVDCSHASPAAARAAIAASRAPIVLSHSNAHALCAHPRNAPDDLIDAVAAGGGLVMATFVPHFVSQRSWNWVAPARDPFGKTPHGADERALRAERERVAGREPRATLADFCDHVDYLIARAGEDHVGIGSDFFGGPAPQGLGHVGRFPHLFAALLARGHSEERLVKIAGGNVLRAMREVAARGAELRVREAPRLGRIEDWDRAGTAGQ